VVEGAGTSLTMRSASSETALYTTPSTVTAGPPAVIVVCAIARPPPSTLETPWPIVLMTACDASLVRGSELMLVVAGELGSRLLWLPSAGGWSSASNVVVVSGNTMLLGMGWGSI
jgi:hypothetical protein